MVTYTTYNMLHMKYVKIIFGSVVAMLLYAIVSFVTTTTTTVSGYDVAPTVDSAADSRTLLSGTPQVYRFGQTIMKNVTYSDGSVVPTATMSIERLNQTSQKWEIIGYTNTHLHKLKIDTTDMVDISVGHTDRINIKQKAPTTIPTVVD